MKFEEIPAPNFSLRIKPNNSNVTLLIGDVFSVELTSIRNEFKIYTMESVFTVIAVNHADGNQLSSILSSGRTILAKLTDSASDGSAELTLFQFYGEKLEMDDIDIGIDEKVQSARALNNSRKNDNSKISLEDAAIKLKSSSVLEHCGKNYFFILAGDTAKEELEGKSTDASDDDVDNDKNEEEEIDDTVVENDDSDEENGSTDEPNDQESLDKHRNFAILGSDYRFAVAEKDKGNGETVFLASRITRMKNNYQETALRLACGNLRFLDWTEAGERAILAKTQLEKLTRDKNSYLSRWDEFVNVEGELLLERARKLGVVFYSVKEERKDGTIIIQCKNLTDEQVESISKQNSFDFVEIDNIPEFLNSQDMTYSEYSNNIIKAEDYGNEISTDKYKNKSERSDNPRRINLSKVKGREEDAFNISTGELWLEAEAAPSEKRVMIYSIAGDITQIKRRLSARKNIQNGRSANPNLGLLIEENGRIPPSQKPPKIPELTDFVKQKVFPHNPPTVMQQRAIKVALNTPDIALIQGPPGTGKTTVIAAIIERLNQESEKRVWLSGRVLLTGFQHDAVENMTDRLKINGLPVPKFGQRSGEPLNEGLTRFENDLSEWCNKRSDELRAKNPQITESTEEKYLRDLCVQYINAPSLLLATELLKKTIELPDRTLGEPLRKRLQKELALLNNELNNDQNENELLPFIRGLRTTEKSFTDDGASRAGEALYALRDELDDADKDLLKKASLWNDTQAPPFISELKKLKRKLLIQYTPAPVFQIEKPRDTVIDLIKDTIIAIKYNGTSTRDKKTAALAELLLEMENNLEGIKDAVKDYCYAFAATCQQSVSLENSMKKESSEYDFVIVDEAARVSPLDLMIAMAQGKRIILVGDHRQLPQLIDDEVVGRMLEESDNPTSDNKSEPSKDTENEWLKKSMFEYLFTERLPVLEKMDGIQRRVTLDAQYRMHPTLGNFISRNFYERFNPEEKFKSGLPERFFTQHLSGTDGKCAVWIDVPENKGKMTRFGTSWIRQAESDVICSKLKEWIEEDDNRTDGSKDPLRFGVIAFYKAQTDLIKRRLGAKFLEHVGEKRLRIGTVDAFQGMEFDVVFLSLVRTPQNFVSQNPFGFLQVYNRLNVSMSRQKKLLVVVGDKRFYDTDVAKEKVPGLADFLKLCREKGRIL